MKKLALSLLPAAWWVLLGLALPSCTAPAPALAQTPFGDIDEETPVWTAADTAALATNLNVRAAPTGAGVADTHGCVHDAPVEIGVGARAAPDGGGARSVSVAIGAGSDATDPGNQDKSQAIAIGNQSRAAAVNTIAIGSGVRHDDEDDMSGGNAYAAAPQAAAIGYAAKALAGNAWQLGTGTNDTPDSVKFNDVYIVKDGKVAVGGTDTNTVAAMIRAEAENGVIYGETGNTNGYNFIRLAGVNERQGTDPELIVAISTNADDDVAISFPVAAGSPNRREVYSCATVDRLVASVAPPPQWVCEPVEMGAWTNFSAGFEEDSTRGLSAVLLSHGTGPARSETPEGLYMASWGEEAWVALCESNSVVGADEAGRSGLILWDSSLSRPVFVHDLASLPDRVAALEEGGDEDAFEEYAASTYDRIAAEAVPASTITTNRADTSASVGRASGYALRAVRTVRASRGGGMDTETDIDGAWAIVGSTDAATLSSNVLQNTSSPGDVTVEFTPSDGSSAIRAAVSMPGDAIRTATVWPSGEANSGWRIETLDAFAGFFDYPNPPVGGVYTNTWSGSAYICTNFVPFTLRVSATAPNPEFNSPALAQALCVYASRLRWRSDGGTIAGGVLGAAPHYVLYARHTGGFPESSYQFCTNWASGLFTTIPRGEADVATWGDLTLRRLTRGEVPPQCVAKYLRASTLAALSPSQLFRAPALVLTQHGAVASVEVEPRVGGVQPSDLSGASWDGGWVARGLRDEWPNVDAAGLRWCSHAAHGGDSGHPCFLGFSVNHAPAIAPVGLFHWASGSGECLLSDALLDKIDAAIQRDSGGAESLSYYTLEELQR